MFNTSKELKAKLQSLLERGHVDEYFVEDVRDLIIEANYDRQVDAPELFEGTLQALETLDIDVMKMREGTYYKQ